MNILRNWIYEEVSKSCDYPKQLRNKETFQPRGISEFGVDVISFSCSFNFGVIRLFPPLPTKAHTRIFRKSLPERLLAKSYFPAQWSLYIQRNSLVGRVLSLGSPQLWPTLLNKLAPKVLATSCVEIMLVRLCSIGSK